ncbi:hypothetical protein [Bradyrhizobium vignae]|uniref:Uncharacterized protein n=1 Tax=Bradyrhizobium vignae TaxID=1549949 RepID=A0ABS3ZXG6_9BRAD|nr:hypothetical protein [Bradyrhizobium vignae]MBP0112839.1 hypothetical protein [Bradyrhizobium vignae]
MSVKLLRCGVLGVVRADGAVAAGDSAWCASTSFQALPALQEPGAQLDRSMAESKSAR